VYQAVQPSLVLIQTTLPHGQAAPDATPDEDGGLGSGVVVSRNGDILTSLHVIAEATEIKLTFADGSTSGAEIVVRQPEHDIAVLRATQPPANLVPAVLGNPAAVRQGSEAYAMGSPFGLYGSMSVGVISGLDRSFQMPGSDQVLTGLFQIDAAVNPGNSGGALTDREGHVIGIVTALINPTEDDVFIGIGLAVPIDVAGGAAGLPPY
jgi:S1-C subfamily serine protease